MKRTALLLLLSVATAACSANWRAAHRSTPISGGAQAIAVDAKQRFLISMMQDQKLKGICLEPSPDVFSVMSAAIEANANYKDAVKASMKVALAEAAATIGVRTETIQLLRDAMYRICELANNDKMDSIEAARLHESYQKSMVTLAAVAALADASRPVQVGISSNATVTRGALMAKLDNEIKEAEAESVQAEEGGLSADATLKQSEEKVCAEKVKKDSCEAAGKTAADCLRKDGDTPLCDVGVGNVTAPDASDRPGRAARAQTWCGAEAQKEVDSCKRLWVDQGAKTAADDRAKRTKETVAKLEEEREGVKRNSDLGATTQVVTLSAPAVQPRAENIHEVAQVVNNLVSQVYEYDLARQCVDAVVQREARERQVAELGMDPEALNENAPAIASQTRRIDELTSIIEFCKTVLGSTPPNLSKQAQPQPQSPGVSPPPSGQPQPAPATPPSPPTKPNSRGKLRKRAG